MKFFTLALLLFAFAILSGQALNGTLSGHLFVAEKPVAGANILLTPGNIKTTSDSNGYYLFKAVEPGKYLLHISCLGYENVLIGVVTESGKSTILDTMLQPLSSNLHDVIVTGNLEPSNKSQSVETIDVLSSKEFVRNPVSNVFDALTYAKGIYCDIDQGMTNPVDININGLEGNYTMYTIDGVPAMNNLAGIFALSAFPVSMVDNIQIEGGSNSTVYGTDAMGGVINIVTKDPATAPRLALNLTMTSKLESELGLTTAFRLKKVNMLFSVASDNMNYRWDINHDGFMDIPLVNRTSFFNKWSFIRKQNRVATIYARYLFEDRFTGQMNTPGRLLGSDEYYTQWLRTNQWQAGFQYQLPVREKIMLLADYSEHYQQAWFDTIHYHGALRNAYTQLSWSRKFSKHNLTAGATYRMRYYKDNTGLSDQAITGIGNFVHTAGIFAIDQVTLNTQNTILYGVRFDYSNLSGPVAAPRFSYKWNTADQKDAIRLALGTGYRVPNVLNEGFTALETSRQVIVPQKLKTEYAVSMNLDYSRTQVFSAGILKFEGGIFGIYLTNFVEPDYETDSAAVIYNNNQGGGSFGCNASIDWAFKFPLHFGFNCTYAFTFELDKDSGEDDVELEIPTHAPPFTGNFYVSYTLPQQQITFDLTGNIISPMLLATVDNDFRPSESPWFSIMNFQVTKKFGKGFELFAGVKNLLNFVQQNPILRPFDPFNRYVATNNPNGYRFDTTYAYSTIEGINGFVGFRYVLQ
jgi:outer membrane receptor for ferrienterochelin and colicins